MALKLIQLTGGNFHTRPLHTIYTTHFTSPTSAKKPANVLGEGSRRASESSILFSSESDFTGG